MMENIDVACKELKKQANSEGLCFESKTRLMMLNNREDGCENTFVIKFKALH